MEKQALQLWPIERFSLLDMVKPHYLTAYVTTPISPLIGSGSETDFLLCMLHQQSCSPLALELLQVESLHSRLTQCRQLPVNGRVSCNKPVGRFN